MVTMIYGCAAVRTCHVVNGAGETGRWWDAVSHMFRLVGNKSVADLLTRIRVLRKWEFCQICNIN